MKQYKIVFRPEPEGGYTAVVPTLPGCVSYGETLEEARKMIKDAVICFLKCKRAHEENCCDDKDCLVEELTVKDE